MIYYDMLVLMYVNGWLFCFTTHIQCMIYRIRTTRVLSCTYIGYLYSRHTACSLMCTCFIL